MMSVLMVTRMLLLVLDLVLDLTAILIRVCPQRSDR